jgi:hypothetical protein
VKKLQHQPRLKDGLRREGRGTALHPFVVKQLRVLARSEGRSCSWIIAEAISIVFGVDAATGKIVRKRGVA